MGSVHPTHTPMFKVIANQINQAFGYYYDFIRFSL